MYNKIISIIFNNRFNKKIRMYSTKFHSNKPPNNNNYEILVMTALLGLFLTIKKKYK